MGCFYGTPVFDSAQHCEECWGGDFSDWLAADPWGHVFLESEDDSGGVGFDQFGSLLPHHSRATVSKLSTSDWEAFSAFLSSLGSMPAAICFLARLFCFSWILGTHRGYMPSASSFSLRWRRYFSLQYREPLGLTIRNSPPPSNSLYALSLGLAFRTAVSVRVMLNSKLGVSICLGWWGTPQDLAGQRPQSSISPRNAGLWMIVDVVES
jgi:hypothetical protein